MAQLAVQKAARTGLNPAFQAAAVGGDSFPFNSRVIFHVKNGGGASINVNVNSQDPCDQGFDHDEVVAVPAGGERMIGAWSDRFADANGNVQVTYSAVTTVTVAAYEP